MMRDDTARVRLDQLGRGVPVLLLGVATVLAWGTYEDGYGTAHRFHAALVVATVALVWSLVFVTLARARPRSFAVAGLLGHLVFAAVLVALNPWYGVFAWTGFLILDGVPHRVARIGLVATALILAASQVGGYPTGSPVHWAAWLFLAAVEIGLVALFARVTNRVTRQNQERGVMIERLNGTNAALEAALAENAGLHAQLVEQAREAGALDERQRLAGELHDTLAQNFVGIVTQLEAAERATDVAAARHHLDQARALAREGVTEARRSVRALRPEQLESVPLDGALAEAVATWSGRTGVRAEFESTGATVVLPEEVEDALFRVAQESLTNVDKHADARRVGVTLTFLDGVVALDVRDDGTGWDGSARDGGYGLAGMAARLHRLGGTLTVETAPGDGSAISASVPLRQAAR